MQEFDLEFENISYVTGSLSKTGEMIHVICIDEQPEYKHREYFLNKNFEISAYFEFEHGDVEQLSMHYENIFILNEHTLEKPNTNVKIVRIEPDESKTVLGVYENIEYGEENGTFAVRKNGKWGFINLLGKLIIDCQYDDYYSFSKGVAIVKKNKKWGVINKKNEVLLPFIYSKNLITGIYQEIWSSESIYRPIKRKGKWGITDIFGKIICECVYDDFQMETDELFVLKKDKKYGIIDKDNNIIAPFIYDEIGYFNDKTAIIRIANKYGLIDKKGNIVKKLSTVKIAEFVKDGFYKIYDTTTHRKGFMNKNGKTVIPTKYKKCSDFIDGYCVVEDDEFHDMIINKKDEIVYKNDSQINFYQGSLYNLGKGMFLIRKEYNKYKLCKI